MLASREAERTFQPGNGTPGDARRFVVQVLEGWGARALADDAALIVSELTTNAVLHARSEITVLVVGGTEGVRLSVHDRDPTPPICRASSPADPRGRGLCLVDAISTRWGTDHADDDAKVVWAELRRR